MRNANSTRTASTMHTANIVQSKAGGIASAWSGVGCVALCDRCSGMHPIIYINAC